nr:MAG TPA: resistance protein [Caudoviricetes sp.]
MKLFEINEAIERCVLDGENVVDTETGEVLDVEALNNLKMAFAEKAENIAMFIRNLDAESAALKDQKNIFAARQKAAERKRDSLKEYLAFCLEGKPFKTDRVKVTFRKSEAVKVTDQERIPETYLVYSAPTVDKAGIKKALKSGENVPGCVLEEKQNIQVK